MSELTNSLKEKFNLNSTAYPVSDSVNCFTFEFLSDFTFHFNDELAQLRISTGDEAQELENGEMENQKFRYAVFAPSSAPAFSDAIILLHGLNERKWEKYLPWAHYLVLKTNRPVILFPIAYHMNRSPQTWTCPRQMTKFSELRKRLIPALENSSFANAAISLRMDSFPEFFSIYGIQTYLDVIKLSLQIKSGTFGMFKKDCSISFFAYSIGALLTETLLISNPMQIYSSSRAFFFCGGSTFDRVNGISRSIMDSHAFFRLQNYMAMQPKFFTDKIKLSGQQKTFLSDGWKAFISMSSFSGKFAAHRRRALKKLRKRIGAIALKNDLVMPAAAVRETIFGFRNTGNANIDIMDFPYRYSHEIPFPVNDKRIDETVNCAFNQVFSKAAMFLLQGK